MAEYVRATISLDRGMSVVNSMVLNKFSSAEDESG